MATIDELGKARYVLLTTYRRDGRAVPTAVWAARVGDALVVMTDTDTGKVKRIRANGRATLQRCDYRGRPVPSSAPVEADAELVSDPDTVRAASQALKEKYGLQYRAMHALRRGAPDDSPRRATLRLTLHA